MRHRLIWVIACFIWTSQTFAIGTNFTYQGELQLSGTLAQGSFDFEFTLFDAQTGGATVGSALPIDDVPVVNGVFAVDLDFGASAFDGSSRWLEIRVKRSADNTYQTLNPLQAVNPAPYAIRSETSLVADGALLADTADSVPYLGVSNRPEGLDDGDDDTLDALACSNGQIPVFDSPAWVCGDQTSDTLSSLTCSDQQIPVFNGSVWVCGNPTTDTLNALSCASEQIVVFNGSDWACGDVADDTLAQLSCNSGQVPVFNGSQWQCGDPADGSPNSVCAQLNGDPGIVINGVCLLDYSNSSSNTWDAAASSCASIGGDLCTASQYEGLRGEGSLGTPTGQTDSLFASGRPVWSNDFSDNDGSTKTFALRSSDDPSSSATYAYGCCGNVLPEPARSSAQNVNGVLVAYTHADEDTVWRAAARVCRTQGADLCSKSQYVALNDASTFSASVRRATSELSDNDLGLFDAVVGSNTADNGNVTEPWAYSCCSTARPVDRSCSGILVSGVCVLAINDVEDSNFFDAARACTSIGGDICSNSQMQVIRNNGQFSNQCWTASGGDNDNGVVGGLLGTEPNNADPLNTLRGYACCQ